MPTAYAVAWSSATSLSVAVGATAAPPPCHVVDGHHLHRRVGGQRRQPLLGQGHERGVRGWHLRFVGVGANTMGHSTDGVHFTGEGNQIFNNGTWDVDYNAPLNLWVAVGSGNNSFAYTTGSSTSWIGSGSAVLPNTYASGTASVGTHPTYGGIAALDCNVTDDRRRGDDGDGDAMLLREYRNRTAWRF